MNTKVLGAGTTIFLLFSFVVWIFWSIWWPFDVWDIKKTSFSVLNEQGIVKRGEKLNLTFNYCRHMDVNTQANIAIISGRPWTLEPMIIHTKPGCHSSTLNIEIPATLPLETTTAYSELDGVAHVRIEFEHKINVLRTIKEKFTSEKFTIIP